MNENKSVIKIIDLLIDQAEHNDLYIDYIAVGPSIMVQLAEELSVLVDPQNEKGLLIKSLSAYKDVSIREIEIESITVKYLLNKEEWVPLG